jgi:hypothetical protein
MPGKRAEGTGVYPGRKFQNDHLVNYILPAMESGYIEMTFPDNPNHPNQHYRLTEKGIAMKNNLRKSKRKR